MTDPTPPTQGLVRYDIRSYGNGFPPLVLARDAGVWTPYESAAIAVRELGEENARLRAERLRWIVQLLKARDEFAKCDYAEAWHRLYQIASPDFTKLEPWAEFEQEAALAKYAKEWRPIETAPRSYTPIILLEEQRGVVGEGWYSSHLDTWEFANSQHVMRRNPTHWRPLPDAITALEKYAKYAPGMELATDTTTGMGGKKGETP